MLEKVKKKKRDKVEDYVLTKIIKNRFEIKSTSFDYERDMLNQQREYLKQILLKKNVSPYECEIQPSSVCNANCKHCFGSRFPKQDNNLNKPGAMNEIIENILKYRGFNGTKIQTIKFCGSTGEPTLNPYLIDSIQYAYTKANLRLFTNGILVGMKKEDTNFLKGIAKVNDINFSLDAATTETWQIIKQNNNVKLSDIIEGIQYIKDLSPKTQIVISFVITRLNFKEIQKAVDLYSNYSDVLKFRIDITDPMLLHNAREIWSNLTKVHDFENEKFKIAIIHDELDIAKAGTSYFGSQSVKCFIPYMWTCVGSDGELYPCGHCSYKGSLTFGNLFKKSFSEIWDSPSRQQILEHLPNFQFCKSCSPFSLRMNQLLTHLSKFNGSQLDQQIDALLNL